MSLCDAVFQPVTGTGAGPRWKNVVIMLPTRAVQAGMPAAAAASRNPASRRAPSRSRRAYGGCSRSSSSVAVPAATASGLPDSVPAWKTLPAGSMWSMTSARPP